MFYGPSGKNFTNFDPLVQNITLSQNPQELDSGGHFLEDFSAGGAQQRNLPPPAVGGADLSANTRVSAPVGGVNPGQIFSARNNEGSNIGIPYSRLTPLNNEVPLGKRCWGGKPPGTARAGPI